jgi:hypothetical protein
MLLNEKIEWRFIEPWFITSFTRCSFGEKNKKTKIFEVAAENYDDEKDAEDDNENSDDLDEDTDDEEEPEEDDHS